MPPLGFWSQMQQPREGFASGAGGRTLFRRRLGVFITHNALTEMATAEIGRGRRDTKFRRVICRARLAGTAQTQLSLADASGWLGATSAPTT